ncbi:transposase [Streptomyces pristinaespiralis]
MPRGIFVARRALGGGAVASASRDASRTAAVSRFRHCERCSEARTAITPPTIRPASRSSARSFQTGGSASVLARSKRSSTCESLVLTCWPPGPEDREKRHMSSASGRETEPRMM